MKCERCDGCGRIASGEEGAAWTVWETMPHGSDMAVRAGLVKPLWCPDCGGTGVVGPELRDVRLLEAAAGLLAIVKELVAVLDLPAPGALDWADVVRRARGLVEHVEQAAHERTE